MGKRQKILDASVRLKNYLDEIIAFHDAAGTSEDFAQNPIQQEALETKKLAQRLLLTTAALGAVVHKSRPTAEGVLKELQNGEVTLPRGLLLKVKALGADARVTCLLSAPSPGPRVLFSREW